MRGMFLAILLLAAPQGGSALTWDFDEDTTWGWAAQESPAVSIGGRFIATTVRSEVADGVWRIASARGSRLPSIQLLSPLIGEDSALFDRVTLRLRTIYHSPTEGGIQMWWFNAEHKRLREMRERPVLSSFVEGFLSVFTTDWQELTIALDREGLVWQDSLFYFELFLSLNRRAEGPEDFPDLEVDWIQLTGAEELLLGELPPRAVASASGSPGALLAAPVFSPLGGGVSLVGTSGLSYGVLGDVDGDGAVDLVTSTPVYRQNYLSGEDQARLTVSSNDGQGRFVPTQRMLHPGFFLHLEGHDFDGDGLLDLVLGQGSSGEVWHNRGEAGFAPILQLPYGYWGSGLVDGDGDGDVDLVAIEEEGEWGTPTVSHSVTLWVNDGEGGFVEGDQLAHNGYQPVLPVGQFPGEAVRLLWNRPCYLPTGPWRLSRPWAAPPEPALFFEAAVNPCAVHLLADLDGDGYVDLLGSPERNLRPLVYGNTDHGLALWRLDGSGVLAHHTLFDSEVFFRGMGIARDLNGDGLLDVALVDINLATGPALMVLLGQRDGVPVLEGRYPLPGKGDQVLAGDVDGDGVDDLVVLGISADAGEGVEPGAGNDGAFVFINQRAPVTAVASQPATMPTAFALGANYPNPFNPATTIPLIVPAGAGDVELAIYNVLGQPVRQVWAGPLAAGEHRLGWDGRDAQGQAVAAGVYLYRLQVGEQTRVRKMVKLD